VLCSQAMPTRSPPEKRRTSDPTFSTIPITWWPGITGILRGG